MPKLKTSRAAAKRFRQTGSGKTKRSRTRLRHILTSKSKKSKRGYRKAILVHPHDEKKIRRLMPYA